MQVGYIQILGLLWNGIFVIGIATVAWNLALKYGSTAKISTLAYITPFLSLVWTFFVLKEPIKPLSVIGLMLIIIGIFIQIKDQKRID
jgi:drug/metabolite transporter (DMT)-like permease